MDDGVPLRAVAAELVGIYQDAPTLEDEEYAAEAIDDLLDSLDDDSDDEALVALLGLPETEFTAPLIDDVISMLADTGPRVVERLLDVALAGLEPAAWRALDALDRMDDHDKADGLYDVLAGRGPEDLRRTAADELVALGHAGTSRLQEAYDDPWASGLARAAVEAAAGGPRAALVEESLALADASVAPPTDEPPAGRREAGVARSSPEPLVDGSLATADASAAAPGDEPPTGNYEAPPTDEAPPIDDSWAAPPGESTVEPERPLGPDADALEAEYRAFLERFERDSGA